jgi:hypothetical protein
VPPGTIGDGLPDDDTPGSGPARGGVARRQAAREVERSAIDESLGGRIKGGSQLDTPPDGDPDQQDEESPPAPAPQQPPRPTLSYNAHHIDSTFKQHIGTVAGKRTRCCAAGREIFEFLVADYKPEYYYYECVVLLKKLLLSGLLVFMDRGSMMQATMATFISLIFFTVQVRWMPYVEPNDNILSALAEAQVFVTLVLSIVLRSVDWKTESFQGYDTLLVTVNMAAAPFAFIVEHVAPLLGSAFSCVISCARRATA